MSIDTPKTCPTMVSIQTLSDYKFEIPVYQRGFRWTRQQIKELIDDLYEFSKDASKSTYCLQNVKLTGIFEEARKESDFGNGRYVRNVIEKAKMAQATRLLEMDFDSISSKDITTICAEDIEQPVLAAKTEKKRIGFCA